MELKDIKPGYYILGDGDDVCLHITYPEPVKCEQYGDEWMGQHVYLSPNSGNWQTWVNSLMPAVAKKLTYLGPL